MWLRKALYRSLTEREFFKREKYRFYSESIDRKFEEENEETILFKRGFGLDKNGNILK